MGKPDTCVIIMPVQGIMTDQSIETLICCIPWTTWLDSCKALEGQFKNGPGPAMVYLIHPDNINPRNLTIFKNSMLPLTHFEMQVQEVGQLTGKFIKQMFVQNGPINKNHSFISTVEKVILKYVGEDLLDVKRLSQILHLSPAQVHRKIKQSTGYATGQFIHIVRLRKSHQLIKDTDLNINEIAYQCGYKDPSYFHRLFRRHFKITPGMLRRSNSA